MPLVDIILPTYQRSTLLTNTLSSIQGQTFTDWHCWITEDGHSEHTLQTIQSFLTDTRFSYLFGPHTGTPATPRNRAIKSGSAPYIAFIDDDDLWMPDKLECQISYLEKNSSCMLLGSNAYWWNGQEPLTLPLPLYVDESLTGEIAFSTLIERNLVINSSAIIRRSILAQSGMQDERIIPPNGEDYSLWLRIAAVGEVRVLPLPLIVYRDAPSASIRALSKANPHKVMMRVLLSALKGTDGNPSPLSFPEHKDKAALCKKKILSLAMKNALETYILRPGSLLKKLITGQVH